MDSKTKSVVGEPACSYLYPDRSLFYKRIFDVLFASTFLFFTWPFFLLLAIAIKAESKGPVLFKQKRTGLNGRVFWIYKFRSMKVHREETGIVSQASQNDKRVTRIGRFIRRTSLDEIPQFINVLLGDMSVVGPRPHAIEHDEMYKGQVENYMSRYKVKPGITGLAQVNGCRGETETVEKMSERICFDIEYVERKSFALDVKIVLLTPIRLLSKNAY